MIMLVRTRGSYDIIYLQRSHHAYRLKRGRKIVGSNSATPLTLLTSMSINEHPSNGSYA